MEFFNSSIFETNLLRYSFSIFLSYRNSRSFHLQGRSSVLASIRTKET
ncbi:hypothetical protein LEP1GSC016_1071 [Leptospira borgpetersenii serovar Hardjo-bovis str. Sponselee]|uniref:Uncharacterized protein n=1 Tax=Leptospira borgpetersenii serovar Hardjo-bovis str. Sponselee TaxID=1303729 RepID=M6BF41_LEPBO|nr:hypothetical protein LEP1GSC016_1071 [Leptospira borgpetersenii serovar Hardjo-bovis str. Sponselee]